MYLPWGLLLGVGGRLVIPSNGLPWPPALDFSSSLSPPCLSISLSSISAAVLSCLFRGNHHPARRDTSSFSSLVLSLSLSHTHNLSLSLSLSPSTLGTISTRLRRNAFRIPFRSLTHNSLGVSKKAQRLRQHFRPAAVEVSPPSSSPLGSLLFFSGTETCPETLPISISYLFFGNTWWSTVWSASLSLFYLPSKQTNRLHFIFALLVVVVSPRLFLFLLSLSSSHHHRCFRPRQPRARPLPSLSSR